MISDYVSVRAQELRFLCRNWSADVYAPRYDLNVYLDLRGKVVKTKRKEKLNVIEVYNKHLN